MVKLEKENIKNDTSSLPKSKALGKKKLLQKAEKNAFAPDNWKAKIKVKAELENNTKRFKVRSRIKKDSIIWASISPALGIELFRIMITKDSIKFIDKVKNKYFKGKVEKFEKLFNMNMNLSHLENILAGNLTKYSPKKKFNMKFHQKEYYLYYTESNNTKDILALEKPDPFLKSKIDSLMLFNTTKNTLNKAKGNNSRKSPSLMISRFWVLPETYRPRKIITNDINNLRTMKIIFENHEKVEGNWFPKHIESKVKNEKGKELKFHLNYKQVSIQENMNFPFNISQKYTPIESINKR